MSRLYALLALLSALVVGTSLPCAEAQGAQSTSSKAAVACNHDDLAKLEGQALRVRRNEVFARHGRAFKSKDLQAHFARQSWYRVDPNFSSKRLSPQDNACVARVKLWEKGAFKKVATAQLDGKGGEDNVYLRDRRELLVDPGDCEEDCETCSCSGKKCVVHVGFLDQTARIPVVQEVPRHLQCSGVGLVPVDIDTSDDRTELQLDYHWTKEADADSDEEVRYYTFLRFGENLKPSLQSSSIKTYGCMGGEIKVNGDGTLSVFDQRLYKELVDVANLGGSDHPVYDSIWSAKIVKTTYSMKPKFLTKGKSGPFDDSETSVFPLGSHWDVCMVAACPYVYVQDRGGERKVGEILRNLRSQELETTQSLQLLDLDGQPELVVRLAEEKDEITWLDATWLEVDGQEIAPLGCQSEPTAKHCTLDQRRHRLARGDALELVFDTRGLSGPAKLWAHGYYIPFPTRTE